MDGLNHVGGMQGVVVWIPPAVSHLHQSWNERINDSFIHLEIDDLSIEAVHLYVGFDPLRGR